MSNRTPFALVTGAAGFLGAHLTRELVKQDQVNVVALDDLSGGFEENLVSGVPFVNLPETHKGQWGEGLTVADMEKCVWVRPKFVARVQFVEWTDSEKSASDYTRSSSTT